MANGATILPPDPQQPPISEKVQVLAVLFAGFIASGGMFAFIWCSMWKIFMDAPMLIAISSIVSNISGALTMVFAVRKISQLNQQSDVKNSPQIEQVTEKP